MGDTLQEGEKCLTCEGTGTVPAPWGGEPCPDCAGTGMNDKARIRSLEAKLNILWNIQWKKGE